MEGLPGCFERPDRNSATERATQPLVLERRLSATLVQFGRKAGAGMRKSCLECFTLRVMRTCFELLLAKYEAFMECYCSQLHRSPYNLVTLTRFPPVRTIKIV